MPEASTFTLSRLRRVHWFVPAAVVVVVMHARFLFMPLTTDEGGFMAVARWWRQGGHLYDDVFTDRPQGMIVLFRLLDMLGLDNPFGIRLLAILFAFMGVAACGVITARLAGPDAARLGALLVAVICSVPKYQGYVANGELLSCAPGAVSLACVLTAVWKQAHPRVWLLAVAGFFGAAAMSVKQTGFDAFVTGLAVVAVLVLRRQWTVRERWASVGAMVGGAAVPIAAMVIHAVATVGWGPWWFAIVEYRTSTRSGAAVTDWGNLFGSGRHAATVLALVVLICVGLAIWHARRKNWSVLAVLGCWALLSVIAFYAGGQFYPHYWVILTFPLGTIAAVLLADVRVRRVRMWLLAGILILPIATTIRTTQRSLERDGALLGDTRLELNELVRDWYRDNHNPGDEVVALCSSPALFYDGYIPTSYRYLWPADIAYVPGAKEQLFDLLTGDDAPRYVAEYTLDDACDPEGWIPPVLAARYRVVEIFLEGDKDELRMLELVPGSSATA